MRIGSQLVARLASQGIFVLILQIEAYYYTGQMVER